ncbi:hypothetical protein LINPERHAP2_LOCUS12162, partial [Linum perenne]
SLINHPQTHSVSLPLFTERNSSSSPTLKTGGDCSVNRSSGRRRRLQPISRLTSLSNHCSRRTRPATSSQSQSSNRLSQAFGKHSPEVVRKLIRDLLKTWRIIVANYV